MDNKSTITITFGDQAENHVGMQKIGNMAESGIDCQDISNFKSAFEYYGGETEVIYLNNYLPNGVNVDEDAVVLIARKGVDILLQQKTKYTSNDVYNELNMLTPDKKAKMYGRVVNKKARYNLCFADFSQKSNYDVGKGTVINFKDTPLTNYIRMCFPSIGGKRFSNMMGEANYYYDLKKCGIGFHGDTERKYVIAFRVGESMTLHYQWFYKRKPVGTRAKLMFNHGDIYFMSEKATGNDWKKRNKYTLRHAAGADKFLSIK